MAAVRLIAACGLSAVQHQFGRALPEVALRGHIEANPRMSAFGSDADMRDRLASTDSVAIDPNVWSGRALQEDFFELGDMRSCINVSGL